MCHRDLLAGGGDTFTRDDCAVGDGDEIDGRCACYGHDAQMSCRGADRLPAPEVREPARVDGRVLSAQRGGRRGNAEQGGSHEQGWDSCTHTSVPQ